MQSLNFQLWMRMPLLQRVALRFSMRSVDEQLRMTILPKVRVRSPAVNCWRSTWREK